MTERTIRRDEKGLYVGFDNGKFRPWPNEAFHHMRAYVGDAGSDVLSDLNPFPVYMPDEKHPSRFVLGDRVAVHAANRRGSGCVYISTIDESRGEPWFEEGM